MILFKKKKPEEIKGKGYIPVERVRDLSSKGFSEIEMIDVLRKEGFSPEEIDKALTEALKESVEVKEETPFTAEEKKEMPELPETSLPEEYYQGYATEEYLDYLVSEKMASVSEKVNEFNLKFQELENKIAAIHAQINEITKLRVEGQESIISKIDSLKESISEIEVRLGSLEKAFKETLPALIESVRALSDLVQRLKREA